MTDEQKRDLVIYRFACAEKTFSEVGILMQNNLYNTAVNRLYYACYYAVSALLLNNGLNTKTHSGAIQSLGLHFVDTGIISKESGRYYSKIFSMRRKGDYEDYIDYDQSDVLELIKPAEELIYRIQKILFKT